MREILLEPVRTDTFRIDELKPNQPIFAKRVGILRGMVIKDPEGWILKLGGTLGSSGHYETLRRCLETDTLYGYTFFVED